MVIDIRVIGTGGGVGVAGSVIGIGGAIGGGVGGVNVVVPAR